MGFILDWFLGRISSKDDEYNTIEALPHGGMAEESRKEHSEFGSGYDPLRKIAIKLGMSFEGLIGSKGFKTALESGKYVKTLGKGVFGEARLFEGFYEGQKFQFVRKHLHGQARGGLGKTLQGSDLRSQIRQFTGRSIDSETLAQVERNINLSHEAGFLKELGHTPAVPSYYGESGLARGRGYLYMEYIPGVPLAERAGPARLVGSHPDLPDPRNYVLPKNAVQRLRESLDEAANRGYFNPDLNSGNVIYNPNLNRAFVVDWGQAVHAGDVVPGLKGNPAAATSFARRYTEQDLRSRPGILRSFQEVMDESRARPLPPRQPARALVRKGDVLVPRGTEKFPIINVENLENKPGGTEPFAFAKTLAAPLSARGQVVKKQQQQVQNLLEAQQSAHRAAVQGGIGHVFPGRPRRPYGNK